MWKLAGNFLKEVIFIFHYRQYSSPVLYYVHTTSVVAICGTVGGGAGGDDDIAIDISTISVVAIVALVTTAHLL